MFLLGKPAGTLILKDLIIVSVYILIHQWYVKAFTDFVKKVDRLLWILQGLT